MARPRQSGRQTSPEGCQELADQTLVKRARLGDQQAFSELVERYQDRIFNLLCRKVGRYDEALDLTQEVFLKAYRALGRFEGRSAFYTWLFRIALNTSFTARKKLARRERNRAFSLQDRGTGAERQGDFEPADDGTGPVDRILQTERQALLHAAIGELREDYRQVILLKDIEGLRYQEVAEVLELPVGSIKSRLHRARQALKEKLTGS